MALVDELKVQLADLKVGIEDEIKVCESETKLDEIRISFLGKKGKLTSILKGLGKVEPQERAELGKIANQLKAESEKLLEQRKVAIKDAYYKILAYQEWYDATLQPREYPSSVAQASVGGHIHPISLVQKELEDIFTSMGFSITDGPQVETDYNNFGALNFTDDHPAREMQDTFYTSTGTLLRTHTSAVQVRSMKEMTPPMKIIVPGRVFRYEEIDASHEHTFYQMEGMVIDKKVSVSNLLYLMRTLLKEIFKREIEVRLRPGYFPFVEPGFELDIQCILCNGGGCRVCKKSGWLEVLPCGLVHPNVIRAGGLDPEQWQGAAFGLGLNRLVMMRHSIEDIRHFQDANLSFLRQF